MTLFGNPDLGDLAPTSKLDFTISEIHLTSSALSTFANLRKSHEYSCILESAIGDKRLAEYSIIVFDPFCVLVSKKGKITIEDRRKGRSFTLRTNDPLSEIRRMVSSFKVSNKKFRFLGGAVGYVGFDSVKYWEKNIIKNRKEAPTYPDMMFCLYEEGVIYDHQIGKEYYFHSNRTPNRQNAIVSIANRELGKDRSFRAHNFKVNVTRKKFEDSVRRAKEFIRMGDIFQVVLSKKFEFKYEGDLLEFYSELRKLNPSPYMYFLDFGPFKLVGSSPEMLVRVENRIVETFPIAGTRPRSSDRVENKRLKKELMNDPKEIAEHVMLVDLARNDVGRISKFGTVSVPEFMEVKEFSHVQHIVSRVVGKLKSEADCFDALRSIFPAGTVSGAPKIRAMQIINELETDGRGPYAGCVGYFSFNGNMDSAITIRTLMAHKNEAFVQAGAGIVADSIPKTEWFETEHKARALFKAMEIASKKRKKV